MKNTSAKELLDQVNATLKLVKEHGGETVWTKREVHTLVTTIVSFSAAGHGVTEAIRYIWANELIPSKSKNDMFNLFRASRKIAQLNG